MVVERTGGWRRYLCWCQRAGAVKKVKRRTHRRERREGRREVRRESGQRTWD